MCHVAKFEAFVRRNPDAPFAVKKKVFSAALVAAILYGCESWLSPASLKHATSMYSSCIGSLLGLGKTTVTDLSLIEAGLPSLQEHVRDAQRRCIEKLTLERANDVDDPFMHVWCITQDAGTPAFKNAKALLDNMDAEGIDATRECVLSFERCTFVTCRTMMNPALTTHPMYADPTVCEYKRRALTKFRLSSHNLAI
ncbi:hypothetical protein CAPTEDRAFT_201086 [Capitella teleta]|uniref:Uncharacterized protein n=1 Tax=Capitella teleta TaxID=283909 RepID=R7UD42_CAPTE|nr:hypothetical protein CAPTEDRAFT_201086 [Capitella teleta]|eukprot:ELU04305.1 hypothetical protein CAPTEDRAFT_201086 [Capitella teleta]